MKSAHETSPFTRSMAENLTTAEGLSGSTSRWDRVYRKLEEETGLGFARQTLPCPVALTSDRNHLQRTYTPALRPLGTLIFPESVNFRRAR